MVYTSRCVMGDGPELEKYLVEYGSHVPRPVIQLSPRSLLDQSGNKREEEDTEDCTQAYHHRRGWATRTGNTWLICRWLPNNCYMRSTH